MLVGLGVALERLLGPLARPRLAGGQRPGPGTHGRSCGAARCTRARVSQRPGAVAGPGHARHAAVGVQGEHDGGSWLAFNSSFEEARVGCGLGLGDATMMHNHLSTGCPHLKPPQLKGGRRRSLHRVVGDCQLAALVHGAGSGGKPGSRSRDDDARRGVHGGGCCRHQQHQHQQGRPHGCAVVWRALHGWVGGN